MISYVVIPSITLLLIIIRKYREHYVFGYFKEKVNLMSKVCIVTGSNGGIGKETVKELLKMQATVIMACRNSEKTSKAVQEIRSEISSGKLIDMELDLSSLASIKKFCDEVLQRFDKIHILINNAGVAISKYEVTSDGFEINMGVNHLGHFLLTELLLDRIKESAPSRIVAVSSKLFEKGEINLRGIEEGGEKNFAVGRTAAYSNSKLANIYFCRELSKKLSDSGVDVYALCPGLCYTDIFRNFNYKWYQVPLFAVVAFFFMRSAHQGAQTVLCCAASKELEGKTGRIYRNCKEYSSSFRFNDETQKKLWDISVKLVNRP